MNRSYAPMILAAVTFASCRPAPPRHVASAQPAPSPTASRTGSSPLSPFEAWTVTRSDGPALDVYVARQDPRTRKPLVIVLQGSHCLPLFMLGERDGRRREMSTLLFYDKLAAELPRASFAVIERRGLTSFGAPPANEDEARRAAQCTPAHGGVSKRERVEDAADVVRAFAREPWVGPILLLGHSEGAYVASGVVRELGDGLVSTLGLLSGPGPTQFFDFIVEARRSGDLQQVKEVFDELLWITSPSAAGDYRGAAIERQLTYGIDSTNIDDLRASNVPIFVASGTDDAKSPIEAADVFVAEMLRDRSRSLRYLMLPGLDHGYHSAAENKDHAGDVLAAFLDWALAPVKDRSVLVGLGPATIPPVPR